MVELGFMPKDLTSGTNEYQVHYPGPHHFGQLCQAPPKDYAKWQELVRGLHRPSGAALWRRRR
jgi:hypothetical protein